jgi:hypothetical protein
MVFAKTKLVISENVLSPGTPRLTLEYKGPNPQSVYYEARKLIPLIFRIAEDELQEAEFFWDRSKAEERFSIKLNITKDLDEFTYFSVSIAIAGFAKPSKEFGKEGAVTIEMSGEIHTEYPQDTALQRLLGGLFLRRVYAGRRKEHKSRVRDLILQFHEQLKSFLNLLPKRG